MKVLFSASIVGHFKNFHVPYLQYFKNNGFEVHTIAGGENAIACVDRHFDIPFSRSPLSTGNLSCYRALKKVIDENQYDVIHCHTPVVGVLTRLAARKSRKRGTTVIYTAHGFHFFDGAPRLRARLFRMIEKMLCRYTDHLITINQEDYEAITKYHFKPGAFYKVPGVGTDAARFVVATPEMKSAARVKLNIDPGAFVLIFAAEYSHRKNQKMLFEMMRLLKTSIPQVLLLLPGEGPLRNEYEKSIETLGLGEFVQLMGYRRDMDLLLCASDVAVSSSVQEGMGLNLVEAMATSLPVVATRIRGHVDVVQDGENGFLVELDDAQALADRLLLLYNDHEVCKNMRSKTRGLAQPFFLENAKAQMIKIYDAVIGAKG